MVISENLHISSRQKLSADRRQCKHRNVSPFRGHAAGVPDASAAAAFLDEDLAILLLATETGDDLAERCPPA
jgi:hypothetical protein